MKQFYAPHPYSTEYSLKLYSKLKIGDLLTLSDSFHTDHNYDTLDTALLVTDIQIYHEDIDGLYPECVKIKYKMKSDCQCACPSCYRKYVNTVITGARCDAEKGDGLHMIYANTLGYYDLLSDE